MGEKWKQWQILLSWAPKITVDGDCSHEIKRRLLLGRKAMTNLDSKTTGKVTGKKKIKIVTTEKLSQFNHVATFIFT